MGLLDKIGDPTQLVATAEQYLAAYGRCGALRRYYPISPDCPAPDVMGASMEAITHITAKVSPWEVADVLSGKLLNIGSAKMEAPSPPRLRSGRGTGTTRKARWVIEDMITRDSLVLIVAGEGAGKGDPRRAPDRHECGAGGSIPFSTGRFHRSAYCTAIVREPLAERALSRDGSCSRTLMDFKKAGV